MNECENIQQDIYLHLEIMYICFVCMVNGPSTNNYEIKNFIFQCILRILH